MHKYIEVSKILLRNVTVKNKVVQLVTVSMCVLKIILFTNIISVSGLQRSFKYSIDNIVCSTIVIGHPLQIFFVSTIPNVTGNINILI